MDTVPATAVPVNATRPATERMALATFRHYLRDRGDFSSYAEDAVVAYVVLRGTIDRDAPGVRPDEADDLLAALAWSRQDAGRVVEPWDVKEDTRWDDTREAPDEDTSDFPPPAHDPDDEPDSYTPDENWRGRRGAAALGGTRGATDADLAEFRAEYDEWSSSLDFPAATNPDWLLCPVVRDFDREYEESRVPMFGYE